MLARVHRESSKHTIGTINMIKSHEGNHTRNIIIIIVGVIIIIIMINEVGVSLILSVIELDSVPQ